MTTDAWQGGYYQGAGALPPRLASAPTSRSATVARQYPTGAAIACPPGRYTAVLCGLAGCLSPARQLVPVTGAIRGLGGLIGGSGRAGGAMPGGGYCAVQHNDGLAR